MEQREKRAPAKHILPEYLNGARGEWLTRLIISSEILFAELAVWRAYFYGRFHGRYEY